MRVIITATLALFIALATLAVHAHATLQGAEPRAGSTVGEPPREVTLHFSQRLEPSLSSITVTDDSGQRVDAGQASVSGTTMSVPLRAIGPGTYHVSWRALSVDTHTSEGSFSFTVGGR
jgi:methionine-rich copper-binding protein CopC